MEHICLMTEVGDTLSEMAALCEILQTTITDHSIFSIYIHIFGTQYEGT